MGNIIEVASTYEYRTYGLNKIVHGIDICGEISQMGHGARGSEQSAEQQHAYHKEPHHEDGLLHGVAIVGDDKSETAPEEGQQHCQGEDEPKRPLTSDVVEEPREHKAYDNHE